MYETTGENTLLIISNSYISIQGRTLLKIIARYIYLILILFLNVSNNSWGCRGRDRMVVGFTTTCAISPSHH